MLKMSSHKHRSSLKSANVSFMVSLIFIFGWISPINGTITILSLLTNETVLTVNEVVTTSFLSESLIAGIQGFLVHSNPVNACSQVTSPPVNDFPARVSFYLLAQGYDCEYKDKMENAHKAGYDGIIIHNVNSNTTAGMGEVDSGTSDLIHYAGFVGEYDGHLLMNYSLPDHKGYFIKIQDGEDLTLLGIIVLILLALLKMLAISLAFTVAYILVRLIGLGCEAGFNWMIESIQGCWRRRNYNSCRRRYGEWLRRTAAVGASTDAPIQDPSHKNSSVTCVVCLEDFVRNDRISILPCSHAFHNVCILRWLTEERKVCPLCQRVAAITQTIIYSEDPESRDTDDDEAPLVVTPAPATARNNEFRPNVTSVFSQPKYLQTNHVIQSWFNSRPRNNPPQNQFLPDGTSSAQPEYLQTQHVIQSWFNSRPRNNPPQNQFLPNGNGTSSVFSQPKCLQTHHAIQSWSDSRPFVDLTGNACCTPSGSGTSVVDEAESNIATNHQNRPFLAAVSKSLPSSSAGNPERIVPSHLSHSTNGLSQSRDVTGIAAILDDTELSTPSGQSYSHYLIPEPEDEEMLDCTVEVDEVDPGRDNPCDVVAEDGSDHPIAP